LVKRCAASIALGIEVSAVLIVTFGVAEAFFKALCPLALLGLEFELAADVVRTAISPTWTAIGHLGAIGAIRPLLNYFLEEDIDKDALNEGKPGEGGIGEPSMLEMQKKPNVDASPRFVRT
jgi:Protein of unknown function (DUF1622)